MVSGSRRSLSASVSGWKDGGGRVAWNYNCDFNGPVYAQLRIPSERCGPACEDTMKTAPGNTACTHFVHRDGICFLKSYVPRGTLGDGPNYPVTWNEPNRICGFVVYSTKYPGGNPGR
jgi:hypothetical protein